MFLPSGAHVVVTRNWGLSEFVNVDITPGLADIGSTSGLCGNFDGNRDNDGRKEPIPRLTDFSRLIEEDAKLHRYKTRF